MSGKKLCCLLLALILAALVSTSVAAQNEPQTLVVQLGPETGQNQGIIWQAEADWQFDGQAKLPMGNYVGQQTGQLAECRSFLYFPLDELPYKAQVQSAVLELYVDNWPFAGSGEFGVYQVQAEWAEPFGWEMQPEAGPTAVFSQTVTASEGWTTWDITSLVQSWADGDPNYGLMMAAAPQPETHTGWAAAARGRLAGGDSSLLPKLTVVYEPVQPPPPAPGPETPPVVPEPSTLALLGSAVSGLALYVGQQIRSRRH